MSRLGPALVAAAVALALAQPVPALAHAVILGSDPPDPCGTTSRPADLECATGAVLATPPATVRVWFSERVEPFGDALRVLDPSGRRVERGAVRVAGSELSVDVDASRAGTYLVRWQVVSD